MRRLTAAVLAAAAIAALGLGASGVSAADKPSLADDVAVRLGVSPDKLREAFKDALEARIDAAVKAGKLTSEQGARLKERIEKAHGLGRLAFRRAIDHHRGLPFFPGIHVRAHAQGLVAKYIGVTPKELRTELRSGKSLAQIATAHGKTEEGLVNAIVAPLETRLDKAVQDTWLTQQQADAILARITDAVKKAVERTPPVRVP